MDDPPPPSPHTPPAAAAAGEEAPPPKPNRRAGLRRRLPFYLVALAAAVVGTLTLLRRDPQAEVENLAQSVLDSDRPQRFYRHQGSSLGLYGRHGYSLTLYVGDVQRFHPARYLILSRLDGQLKGELIKHQGSRGVSILTGARLEAYLERAELDLSAVERAHAFWVTQRAALKR